MIEKVTFTPQVPVFRRTESETALAVEEQPVQEKGNSGALLMGSLAALSAFGLGMLSRKPKVAEKAVEKIVKEEAPKVAQLTRKEQELGWKAAVKNNKYMYIAETTSQKTKKVSDSLIKASNPQMRPEELSPELVKLRKDIQARYALADAEKINKKAVINEKIIQRSNPHISFEQPAKEAHEAKELELLELFNPEAYKNRMINTINHKNALERAEQNTIFNNTSEKSRRNLKRARIKAKIDELDRNGMSNGVYKHKNGNNYIIENGKVVKIIDMQTQNGKPLVINNEMKIAKHLAKHGIDPDSLINNAELAKTKKELVKTKKQKSQAVLREKSKVAA